MNNHTTRSALPLALVAFLLMLVGCSSNPAASKLKTAASYNAKLGVEYLRKGRMRLANEKLQKALIQNPRSADAHHYYALLQETLKQDAVANKHFVEAVRYMPDNPELNNNYGSFLCKQNNFVLAETYFLKAIEDPLYVTPAYALTNAGICSHDAGKLDKAQQFFRRALKKQANFSPALYATAKLAYDQRNYSRAQAFLFRYHENAGKTPESLVLCRQIHAQLGEPKKAATCLVRL